MDYGPAGLEYGVFAHLNSPDSVLDLENLRLTCVLGGSNLQSVGDSDAPNSLRTHCPGLSKN